MSSCKYPLYLACICKCDLLHTAMCIFLCLCIHARGKIAHMKQNKRYIYSLQDITPDIDHVFCFAATENISLLNERLFIFLFLFPDVGSAAGRSDGAATTVSWQVWWLPMILRCTSARPDPLLLVFGSTQKATWGVITAGACTPRAGNPAGTNPAHPPRGTGTSRWVASRQMSSFTAGRVFDGGRRPQQQLAHRAWRYLLN